MDSKDLSLFAHLSKVNNDLAYLGSRIEQLFYEHPAESIINMRKFGEGALKHYLKSHDGLNCKTQGLGELLRYYSSSNSCNVKIYKTINLLKNIGNKAAHFQSNQVTFTEQDKINAFQSTYIVAKWLYEVTTGLEDYPTFHLPYKKQDELLIKQNEENALAEGWYSYYQFLKGSLSNNFNENSEEPSNQAFIEKLIDENGIDVVAYALMDVIALCHKHHASDETLPQRVARSTLLALNSPSTRQLIDKFHGGNAADELLLAFRVAKDSPIFDSKFLSQNACTNNSVLNMERQKYGLFVKSMVNSLTKGMNPDLLSKLHCKTLYALVRMISEGYLDNGSWQAFPGDSYITNKVTGAQINIDMLFLFEFRAVAKEIIDKMGAKYEESYDALNRNRNEAEELDNQEFHLQKVRPFICVSIATTGISWDLFPERLIGICAQKFVRGAPAESFCAVLNPGRPYPEVTFKGHIGFNVDKEKLIYYPLFQEVVSDFIDFLKGYDVVVSKTQSRMHVLDNELINLGKAKLSDIVEFLWILEDCPGCVISEDLSLTCKRLGLKDSSEKFLSIQALKLGEIFQKMYEQELKTNL